MFRRKSSDFRKIIYVVEGKRKYMSLIITRDDGMEVDECI